MELLISSLIGLAMMEAYAWLPTLSKWLLDVAVGRLPEEERERCQEEWNAALQALPNTIVRTWHAGSFLFAARAIQVDVQNEAVRALFDMLLKHHDTASVYVTDMKADLDDLGDKHRSFSPRLKMEAHGVSQHELDQAYCRVKEQWTAYASEHERFGVLLALSTARFEKYSRWRRRLIGQLWSYPMKRRLTQDFRLLLESCDRLTNRAGVDACKTYAETLDRIRFASIDESQPS